MLTAAGCGSARTAVPPPPRPPPTALSPWPSEADYGTIRIAAAVRDHALFHERDWRRKSYAAQLALRTLVTVRIAAGPCATYVGNLYGNLRDLQEAYRGEDWRPLYALVHRQPPVWFACRRPSILDAPLTPVV